LLNVLDGDRYRLGLLVDTIYYYDNI
jgi:hypothetical protein